LSAGRQQGSLPSERRYAAYEIMRSDRPLHRRGALVKPPIGRHNHRRSRNVRSRSLKRWGRPIVRNASGSVNRC
jgi:hypothetical protein